MISLDLSVRFGDLLQIATLVGGGAIFLVNFKSENAAYRAQAKADTEAHAKRLASIESEMSKQTDILTRLAAGEERMNGLDRRIELMEDTRRVHA